MSGRGRRARGRPPRTPITNRKSHLLRKPKAFGGGYVGENSSSRSSTPLSISPASTPTRGKFERGRTRESANKGRNFIQSLFDDDDLSRDSFDGTGSLDGRSVNYDEDDDLIENGSDDSFEDPGDDESDYSVESAGNSSTARKKVIIFRRPKSPEIPFDQEVPPLILPQSSNDLLIPAEYLMQCIGIYEVLRHFRTIARLSPFTFEDFCASLLGEEQCTLHSEIHVNLIKAILREEEANSSSFGPSDVKDSINISLFFLDSMTWPEVFRAYLESDKNLVEETKDVLFVLQMPDFPFVSVSDKLKVLQTLSDLFLSTNRVREEILNEGNIHYDDHCRACHKLGDLLCCETCSAVYHLACVDPPLEEVPDDDWLCSVCKAHQVKGVTDCTSEAERGGLLCRQEPLGYDRHGRKYWFLSRRLIVEGENEVWYYSTPGQIAEVLEEIDKEGYERELFCMIRDTKDDIMKHMKITEEITNLHANNKKSALDIEKEKLAKLQLEREQRKAKELEEKRAREEEERQRREEEARKAAEELFYNGDDLLDTAEEVVISKSESEDTSETSVTKETVTTTNSGTVTTIEEVRTTTTTNTTVTSITHENGTKPSNLTGTVVPRVVIIDGKQDSKSSSPVDKKSDRNDNNNSEGDKVTSIKISEALPADASKTSSDKKVVYLSNSQDGKPNTTIMNIQSVCPNSKATILKAGDKLASENKGATVVVLNKDGGQLKFTVGGKTKPDSKDENGDDEKMDDKDDTENGQEKSKYVTRSKTGSLTPKLFSDSVMGSTSIKTTGMKSSTSATTDEVLVINKDGEITRITRNRLAASTSIFNQQQYFKLGMDGTYKQYVNQYSTQTLALNKHQHNEERDRRRYLSHKFSLTNLSEFKWHGTVHGNKIMTVSTLRLSILQLENSIATPFLHTNWQLHRQSWQKALQKCSKPEDFALALSILEASIKPVLLLPVWHEALGHVRLKRITSLDREELKKREKEQRRGNEEENLLRSLIWIKYTLGLKHQVWKQRGEEYRVSGGQGWLWISSNRKVRHVDMSSVGLRAVAKKLQARRRKMAEDRSDDDPGVIVIAKSGEVSKAESVKVEESETVKDTGTVLNGSSEGNTVKTDIDMKDEVTSDINSGIDVKEEVISEEMEEKSQVDIKEEVVSEEVIVSSEMDVKEEIVTATEEGSMDLDVKEEVIDETGEVTGSLDVKEEIVGESEEIKQEHDEMMVDKNEIDEKENIIVVKAEDNSSASDMKVESKKVSDEKVDSVEKVDISESKPDQSDVKLEQGTEEGQSNIDVESVSPRKNSSKSMKSQGNIHVVKHNLGKFSLLTDKADVDLIDVSKAITEHTYYPKISKPYAKLDNLLERRLKMKEAEKRQRDGIEQQIQWKLKLEAANNTKGESASPEKKIISLPVSEKVETSEKVVPKQLLKYECYSPLCKIGDVLGGECYSVQCRYYTELEADMEDEEMDDDTEDVSMEVDDDGDEEPVKAEPNTVKGDKTAAEDEEVDIMGEKEDKTVDLTETEDETDTVSANQNSNNMNSAVKSKPPVMHVTETKTGTNVQITSKGVAGSSNDSKVPSAANLLGQSPGTKRTTTISIPGNLAQMIAAKGGTTLTMSQAQQLIRETLEKMSVEDLRAKVPPERKTSHKIKLLKMSKLGVKRKAAKKTSLPIAHKFKSPSGVKSLFVLEKWEERKLARRCGRTEVTAFKYDCKMNNVNWPYPCPRPLFKTAFRYRMQTVKSLAGAAIGLRILWACVRWDDMATKAPAGGTNTISTETEITTTELLKRRDVGPFNMKSEFLVRKIVVPLGVPQQPKEKYTPQRSGLRERKRAESPKVTEPSVTERWVPEEKLELWEIKMFGEKVEKQRAALQEKLTEQQQQRDAAQIKQQMEEQLKQQRVAMQQKRLSEGQPKIISTTGSNLLTTVTGTSSTTAGLKGITTLAPNTLLKSGGAMTTLLSGGSIIKKITQVQPKTSTGAVSATHTIRPMVKVQIPGSTVTLRPAASGVTLAPKPATQEGGTQSVNSVATPTLTAIKMPKVVGTAQTPVKSGGGTVQIRPSVGVSPLPGSNPGHVQNVQIVQGPQGQLQVRGLLQGQQIIRLPDGRLQLITVAQQASQAASTTTQSAASTPLTAVRALQPPTAAVTAQSVLVSSSPSVAVATTSNPATPISATSPASTPQTKVIIPSQAISSLPGLTSGAIAVVSSTPGVQGTGTINVLSSGGQTVAKIISPTALKGATQVIQKVGGGSQVVALANTASGTRIIRQITPQLITGQAGAAQIVVSGQQSTPQIVIAGQQTTPQIAVAGQQNITLKQQQLQQQKQVLAQQQAQLQQIQAQVQQQQQIKLQGQVVPGSTAAQPTIQATAVIGGQPQTITVTAQQLAALQQQQQIKIVQKPEDTTTSTGQPTVAEQLLKQQQQRQQATSTSGIVPPSPIKTAEGVTATSPPPTSVKAATSAAQQKYAVTPQVVQEVVRQALMQNQAPEIQAKLLALQKHMIQQKQPAGQPQEATSPVFTQPEITKVETHAVDTMKAKPKPLTQEQKDEQSRLAICGHVIKNILDKIEREEKQEQKRQKKQESAEEKQKRMAAAKIQGILFKHKEALKKEIQRKRAQSEKNIHQEIQMEIAEKLRLQQPAGGKRKMAVGKSPPGMVLIQDKKGDMVQQGLPPMPPTSAQVAEAAKAKKKKQKIISTGGLKPLNPKRKLYCVCKTPYDESRFYIGCDLCSNWYHGECVNISEDKAKYIDTFVCDDCKRQQETATEELYCLCRTPYDESQFYIGCDRCQDWFHDYCVGITQKEAEQLDSYICPNCQRKDSADPTNLKELTDTDYDLLHRLMKSLLSHKMAWPFVDAVDPAEVPDYYDVIKDPMDLTTVEANLDNRVYRRLSDFIKDVTKIFNNCRLYNPPDTPFFQCAEVVETFFAQRMKALKDKLLHTIQ